MPRKKKTKEPEIQMVQCPVRGHNHQIELVPHPERPDLVVAYCGSRIVYQAQNPAFKVTVEKPIFRSNYTIPDYSEKGE